MIHGDIIGVTCNSSGDKYMGVTAFRELSIGDKSAEGGIPRQNDFIKIKKRIYDEEKKINKWVDDKELMEELGVNEDTTSIEIEFLTNNINRAFYCQYAAYYKEGDNARLWCYGDGDTARRHNKEEDRWEDMACLPDCPYKKSKQCMRRGQLLFRIPGVTGNHYIFRMTTGSFNSIRNISRQIAFTDEQKGRITDLQGKWYLFIQKEPTYTRDKSGKAVKRPHNIWYLTYEPAAGESMVESYTSKNYMPDIDTDADGGDIPIQTIDEHSIEQRKEKKEVDPERIYERIQELKEGKNIADEDFEKACRELKIEDIHNMTVDDGIELSKKLDRIALRPKENDNQKKDSFKQAKNVTGSLF